MVWPLAIAGVAVAAVVVVVVARLRPRRLNHIGPVAEPLAVEAPARSRQAKDDRGGDAGDSDSGDGGGD